MSQCVVKSNENRPPLILLLYEKIVYKHESWYFFFVPTLFKAGTIRDRTSRDYFDMFGGKNIEDRTGRDGKMI